MNYVGLDVTNERSAFVCAVLMELADVPAACVVGLESTVFTACVYDHLAAKGIAVKVAHPTM
jgi:hypothetical protein